MYKLLAMAIDLAMDVFVKPRTRLALMRAALADIETVKTVRQGLFAVCGLVIVAVITAAGAVMIPIALCLFMPWEQGTRLWVALIFAAVYLTIPVILASMFLSERRWMRIFHVDELVREISAK